jgi:hypothetical protein
VAYFVKTSTARGKRPVFWRGSNGNKGAILATGTYTPQSSTDPIAAGNHGVMLYPMPLQSKDRMVEGSIKLPDSWTGTSLHFINETTGQDLGTYANIVENMAATSPAFKLG